MARTVVTRLIDAPIDVVFLAVADIREFSQAVPEVVRFEFLSEVRSGVGTRFRETRVMKGRESTTELEVTEYRPNEHVRMVAQGQGTVWDTVFQVQPADGQTQLTVTMDARSNKLLPRIMNYLIRGMIQKAIEGNMDSVKAFCER